MRALMVVVAVSTVIAAGSSATAQQFERIEAFGGGPTITVAWGDADGDGDLDLAVGNYQGFNFLFRNDGGLVFSQIDGVGLTRGTFAMVWVDLDNDGDADILNGNVNGWNRVLWNHGDATFVEEDQFGRDVTIALAAADVDHDGDLDIAVGNGILGNARQNFLYLDRGDGTWQEVAAFGVGQTDSLAWGDVDGDGDPDLAVGNGGFGYQEQNWLYRNLGDGTFAAVEAFGVGDTAAVAWGDADNDGDLDLAVGNWDGGENLVYLNDGAGGFDETRSVGFGDTNTVAWGDADNDGDLDLAVGNGDFSSAGQNFLYLNDGDGNFTEVAEFGLGSTDGVAWGDVDDDGDLDLALGNEHSPSQNELWLNRRDGGEVVRLDLVGGARPWRRGGSNRDAIGAKVWVYAAGALGSPAALLGYREVSAHGGFAAQNARRIHVAVPGRSTVDVRIAWPGPDARVEELEDLPAGEVVTLHESLPVDGRQHEPAATE